MAEEIEFRLPSAIPYAYVGVKGTFEEINQIDFEMLAALYANSLSAFQGAELEAAKLIVQGVTKTPAEAPPGDPEAARSRLDAGQKPRTVDEANTMVDQVIKEELGATEIGNVNAPPWEQPKTPKAKPWESKKPASELTVNADFF